MSISPHDSEARRGGKGDSPANSLAFFCVLSEDLDCVPPVPVPGSLAQGGGGDEFHKALA